MQSQPLPQHVSVVIVGAGPTGLAAANLLGLYNIDTLVCERNSALSSYPKAIAIDDEGLRVCQALGLAKSIQAHMMLNAQAHYLSGHSYLSKVAPTSRRNGYPFVSTFYQPALEATLLEGLQRFPHVKTYFQHTVEYIDQNSDCVTLFIHTPNGSTHQLTCDYLLACDGGRSGTRHALGIKMQHGQAPIDHFVGARFSASARDLARVIKTVVQRPFKIIADRGARGRDRLRRGREKAGPYDGRGLHHTQRWLVVDCVNDTDTEPVVRFFCSADRPAVSLPSPGNRRRWEFMYHKDEQDEDLLQPARIQELMRQTRAAHGLPAQEQPTEIVRAACYTFYETIATTFSAGRVFLLGDAAHLMPPFGGQGMNSGLRDAYNLCWKIAMVLQGRIGPRILASYQQERKPHAAQMILFSSLLGRIIMPTSPLAARVRDLCFRVLNRIPPMRESFAEARVKPQSAYRHGLLLYTVSWESRQLAGQMLPQPSVLTLTGQRIRLDDILVDGFTLLRLYPYPEQAFVEIKGELWERLGVRYLCIQPQEQSDLRQSKHISAISQLPTTTQKVFTVIDDEGVMGRFLRNRQNLFVLVRPDRYIIGALRLTQKDLFETTLKKELDA